MYAEMWLSYGIYVNLSKSTHEQIKKFIKIINSRDYDDCYGDFLELDDTHIKEKEYNIDYDYYPELIKKILHINEKDINVIFGSCEGQDVTKTFIGVKLQCLCDTKSGHNTTVITPSQLRDIMLLKNQSQKKYGKRLTEITKLLFPEQNIKPDIVFLSDVE